VIDYYPEFSESNMPVLKKTIMKLVTFNRRRKIDRFVKENMRLTSAKYNSYLQLKKSPPESDVYVVGSDQVWNSQLSNGQLDPAFFLDFLTDTKKISYASSMGRDDVSIQELTIMKEYLKDFSHISVREESAKQLLETAGVSNVINVLDPVFLLKKEDYKKFIKPVKHKKYLLIYSFEQNTLIEKLASEISTKLGLQIIEIGTFRSKYSCDKYMQNIGVEDFLSLVYYADYIITSSFHGTAFSILLNKQFTSVTPSERKTRLENITNIFEMNNRLLSEKDEYSIDELLETIDYDQVNSLVYINSEKSRSFLRNSLN